MKPEMKNPNATIAYPMTAPTDKEPTFPKNTRAGYQLYHKNPSVAPKTHPKKMKSPPFIAILTSKVAINIAERPDARPLKPECMFKIRNNHYINDNNHIKKVTEIKKADERQKYLC